VSGLGEGVHGVVECHGEWFKHFKRTRVGIAVCARQGEARRFLAVDGGCDFFRPFGGFLARGACLAAALSVLVEADTPSATRESVDWNLDRSNAD
jgi:hypothetical protein